MGDGRGEGGWEEKEIQPSCEWNFSGMGGILAGWESGVLGIGRMGV